MIEKIKLSDELSISRIIHGHWRLMEWNKTPNELLTFTKQLVEKGVTAYDSADIYGEYRCEEAFGRALKLDSTFRDKIELITKTGIKLDCSKYPDRQLKIYDYSKQYIIESVENSLQNLNTDRLDLLLLHRPSPLMDFQELASAFEQLKKSGKVLEFGVSNFTAREYDALNSFVDGTLVTNQIEISPYCLEHFENENLHYLQQHKIIPMAWSPLAGGRLFSGLDERAQRISNIATKLSKKYYCSVSQIYYAWLLKHPTKICPIIGSGKLERVIEAVEALDVELTDEDWFFIYNASKGVELP